MLTYWSPSNSRRFCHTTHTSIHHVKSYELITCFDCFSSFILDLTQCNHAKCNPTTENVWRITLHFMPATVETRLSFVIPLFRLSTACGLTTLVTIDHISDSLILINDIMWHIEETIGLVEASNDSAFSPHGDNLTNDIKSSFTDNISILIFNCWI